MSNSSKMRVQLVQLNSAYGHRIYIPYSVGLLQAYAAQFDDVKAHFDFAPYIVHRGSPTTIADQIGETDILGLSCYHWCWELSLAVAKEVRRRCPSCLIMLGGPQVPDLLGDFFQTHPFIDIACHGEGEITFREILAAYREGSDITAIPGLSYHDRATGQVTTTQRRERTRDLDSFPSPYLVGLFDELIATDHRLEWMALWETNRGCPYSCSFCDWGSAIGTKIASFGMVRLQAEIEWMSDNRIPWVFCCDANFGILKRDLELANILADYRTRTGHPTEFRVCFAKNSNDKIFNVAKILDDANMSKGVSLSFQSFNETVLGNIRRRNIKTEVARELLGKYVDNGMVTFSEVIVGLPGETYVSFVDGIATLLDYGQHMGINIYHCLIMPNAEMGDPEYQKEHGIQTSAIPVFQAHSAPQAAGDAIREKDVIIVTTNTLPVAEWRRVHRFAWAVQCFHALGLLQAVAIFMRFTANLDYRHIYEAVVGYGTAHPDSLIGTELKSLDGILDRLLEGSDIDQFLPDYLDINWPPEEASFLRLSDRIDDLFEEVAELVSELVNDNVHEVEPELIDDLLKYQRSIIVHAQQGEATVLNLGANIHEYVTSCRAGHPTRLVRGPHQYRLTSAKVFNGDKERFAREIVWYGRKGGKFFNQVKRLDAISEQAAAS